MSSTTNVKYHTVESVYRGAKNGLHQYDYIHLVASDYHFSGRQFAKVLTGLQVPKQQFNGSSDASSIRGFFEVNWFIILDNSGAEVKPERLIWSISDRIGVPANFNANDYPDLVTTVIDQALRKRLELKDKLEEISEQKAAQKAALSQQPNAFAAL